jgi:hypothetical protein
MIFLDNVLVKKFDGYLDGHERILWVGQPKLGAQFQVFDLFLIPFSAVWFGFSIFWVSMAVQASFLFALFGIPFVIVGFYMFIGRFIVDKRRRDNTVYGLTAQRILIKSGKTKVQIQTFPITPQLQIDLVETKDGRGTIVIGSTFPFSETESSYLNTKQLKAAPTFDQIADARTVFNQILRLQKETHENS